MSSIWNSKMSQLFFFPFCLLKHLEFKDTSATKYCPTWGPKRPTDSMDSIPETAFRPKTSPTKWRKRYECWKQTTYYIISFDNFAILHHVVDVVMLRSFFCGKCANAERRWHCRVSCPFTSRMCNGSMWRLKSLMWFEKFHPVLQFGLLLPHSSEQRGILNTLGDSLGKRISSEKKKYAWHRIVADWCRMMYCITCRHNDTTQVCRVYCCTGLWCDCHGHLLSCRTIAFSVLMSVVSI